MSVFVNASQEEAFRTMMDYFTGRRMRILTSNSPSYIRAECSSWAALSLANAKGEVEVDVTERNGGSYVHLNFRFLEEYVPALIITICGALITCAVISWWAWNDIMDLPKRAREEAWSMVFTYQVLMILTMSALILGITVYSTSVTRKRLLEEFNMFIQSLVSKK